MMPQFPEADALEPVLAIMQATYRSLDGSIVEMTSAAEVTLGGATTNLPVQIGKRVVEFESGRLDFADDVAAALEIDSFDVTLDFERGTLRLGRNDPFILAAWYGVSRSLKLAVKYSDYNEVLAWLHAVSIKEHPDGVVIEIADSDSMVRFPLMHDPPELAQPLVGFGLLTITPLTRATIAGLPEWQGLRTPFGELFTDGIAAGHHLPTIILVTKSAHARFYLRQRETEAESAAALEEVADTLAQLDITWTPP